MPGSPVPVGQRGVYNPHWNAIITALQMNAAAIAGLQSAQSQTITVDQYGNATYIQGQLNQIVTIGSAHQQPGVLVATGLSSAGIAKVTDVATGTITLTAGSTAATLNMTTSGTFTSGQQIGAADVSDPSSGVASPAIRPRTTFTISGSAVTLSQAAAESGTGLYCAACTWVMV